MLEIPSGHNIRVDALISLTVWSVDGSSFIVYDWKCGLQEEAAHFTTYRHLLYI